MNRNPLQQLCLAVVSLCFLGACGQSQPPQTPEELSAAQAAAQTDYSMHQSDSINVQEARSGRISGRGQKRYYPEEKFDLSALPAYQPTQQIKGTLRIWGSNYIETGYLAKYWEEGFRKHHPDARFEYFLPTALVGIPGLYLGKADIAASRQLTFDEVLAFQRVKGYHPLELSVVTGSYNVPGWAPAVGFFVHKDNPITKLTVAQLDGIFGAARMGGFDPSWSWQPERGRGAEKNIRTWGQLGLTGEWADKPIIPYGLTLKYHQQSRIEERIFNGGSTWNEKLREYAHYVKPDGSVSVSNDKLLEDLSNDRYGIAFTNLGYIKPEHKVHGIAVAEHERAPYYEMTIENVHSRKYVLYGESYFYVDRKPGQPLDPKLQEYLKYVLSRDGQQAVVRDGKYLPLTAAILKQQLSKLD